MTEEEKIAFKKFCRDWRYAVECCKNCRNFKTQDGRAWCASLSTEYVPKAWTKEDYRCDSWECR